MRIDWSDIGAGEYYVLRSDNPYYFDWFENRIATVQAGQSLTYLDNDVQQGREYWYTIESDIKSCCNAVMGQVEPEPEPLAPKLINFSTRADKCVHYSIYIQWSNRPDAVTYEIYYATSPKNSQQISEYKLLDSFSDKRLYYRHSGANDTSVYYYHKIRYQNKDGVWSEFAEAPPVTTSTGWCSSCRRYY